MNKAKQFLSNYRDAIITWLVIAILVQLGFYLSVDRDIITFVVVIVGILGQAFAALIAWIGLIPIVGPIVAQVLTLPFIWLLNGVGYLVSIVAIKRGYSKEVLNYRVITVILLIGITLGYILGKLI
jgi:CBS domain containing-hemolysin-like protein